MAIAIKGDKCTVDRIHRLQNKRHRKSFHLRAKLTKVTIGTLYSYNGKSRLYFYPRYGRGRLFFMNTDKLNNRKKQSPVHIEIQKKCQGAVALGYF